MRFNKQELIALASQPSQKFDREGILIVKEKQEGFFRRAEISQERWFRLRGNLLFYLRGPEQWSEPLGVIVLEQCTVQLQNRDEDGHWPFQIVWERGLCYKMATLLDSERLSWAEAIQSASYETIKSRMIALQQKLEMKKGPDQDMDIEMWRIQQGLIMDINEVPLCEVSLSCDNLLCDAHGRPPSPLVVIHVKAPTGYWIRYDVTEVIEKSSNPIFSRTISFRAGDGLTGLTTVRLSVYDMREYVSHTATPLGFAKLLLRTIEDTQRLRVALTSANKVTVGFLTLNGWNLEASNLSASPKRSNGPVSMEIPQKQFFHRRSLSLPPRLGVKLKWPSHGPILNQNFANVHQVTYRFHSGLGGDISVHEIMAESKLCFYLPQQLLGIYIQREKELLQEVICMGELGGQWNSRQMELLDTHLSLLKHYSHARQSLNTFQNTADGKYFKPSSRKGDSNLEFAPVNLHLQRMWFHNDTLNKSGFYDFITVGAFTAHNQRAGKSGGLLGLLQQMKDVGSSKDCMNSPSASRVQMACDAVQAIKQLRGEVVNIMGKLLALAKVKQSAGMMPLAEEIVLKTRTLLSLWDSGLVEESLSFIDAHKVPPPPAPSTPVGTKKSRPQTLSPFSQLTEQLSKLNLRSPELEDFATPSTPQRDMNQWPSYDTPKTLSSVPNVYNANSPVKPVQSSDSSIIEGKMNPHDQQRFYNDHCNNEAKAYANLDQFQSLQFHSDIDHSESSPIDQPVHAEFITHNTSTIVKQGSISKTTPPYMPSQFSHQAVQDTKSSICEGHNLVLEENGNIDEQVQQGNSERHGADNITCNDPMAKKYLDVAAMTNSPSANYYQPSDEPEPWDLTQLNIEASVMCLVSKVKFLCGRCGSPAVRLRSSSTDRSLTVQRVFSKSKQTDSNKFQSIHNIGIDSAICNMVDEGSAESQAESTHLKDENKLHATPAITDDAFISTIDTVHTVIKKGNKFTDGLNLDDVSEWASELRPSMRKLRLAMDGLLKSGRLAHAVLRLRCESAQRTRAQAALQIRRDTCFSQALTSVTSGLICWLWSTEQDIIVRLLKGGLGPLCGFEGLLSLYWNETAMWGDMVVAIEDLQTVMFTLVKSNHSTNTTPHVTGSRGSLVVFLPVPDSLYARFQSKELTFTITAVFFNIGINEKATLAEILEDVTPQERSNSDNFERLNIYYHKYKRILPPSSTLVPRASSRMKPLEDVVENLRIAVQKKKSKNVIILQLAATATRLMNGLRITSCKSAKDRTGMSCTLEQCNLLTNEYHMAEHEFSKALDCMRSEGCRRENTCKNTGVRKYAFTKLQVMALPKQYRPPAGTYGSAQT